MTARVAVLASGGGTNLQAVLDHIDALGAASCARVALVASDRARAGALDRARERDIPAIALTAEQRGAPLDALLHDHDIDFVVLGGYLRLVPPEVTRRFQGRIVNVHPALLPAFGGHGMYGRRVHEAVIAAGARISGATVHFVDEVYDRGPIIAQWPVPVFGDDDADALAARVLRVEHWLLPRVVQALASGRIVLEGDRVRGILDTSAPGAQFVLSQHAGAPSSEVDPLLAR